jgi:multidrug efflux pump subunit AcrA (membrane-fusion protein)
MEIPMFSSKALAGMTAVALSALLGCGSSPKDAVTTESAAPVAVEVSPATTTKLPQSYETSGTVKARVSTTLSARIMGHVLEVRVHAGDTVHAGQIVAVLDARDARSALQQAEAARNEAIEARPEAEAGVAGAKAQLDLAESTFQRMKSLYEQRSITAQEFDEAQARERSARAAFEMAQAKRKQLEAKVRQAEEAVSQARLQLGFAEVAAPFAGLVAERRAEPGMLATPGMPIVVVEQRGGYRLEASVGESELTHIHLGTPARVSLDGAGEFASRAVEIVPALDAASHNAMVKLEINANGAHSGTYGRATFALGERDAVTVLASSVVTEGQVQRVYVVDHGMARARMVRTGGRSGDRVEILTGLAAGESVVVAPPAALGDGAKVEVRP